MLLRGKGKPPFLSPGMGLRFCRAAAIEACYILLCSIVILLFLFHAARCYARSVFVPVPVPSLKAQGCSLLKTDRLKNIREHQTKQMKLQHDAARTGMCIEKTTSTMHLQLSDDGTGIIHEISMELCTRPVGRLPLASLIPHRAPRI